MPQAVARGHPHATLIVHWSSVGGPAFGLPNALSQTAARSHLTYLPLSPFGHFRVPDERAYPYRRLPVKESRRRPVGVFKPDKKHNCEGHFSPPGRSTDSGIQSLNKSQTQQRESNPHFRHGKAVGCRYIMGASNRWSNCQRSEHRVGLEPTLTG